MSTQKPERKYPQRYEKSVPILLTFLGLLVGGMIVFTIAVALGVLTF
jgi:hypothetical protein